MDPCSRRFKALSSRSENTGVPLVHIRHHPESILQELFKRSIHHHWGRADACASAGRFHSRLGVHPPACHRPLALERGRLIDYQAALFPLPQILPSRLHYITVARNITRSTLSSRIENASNWSSKLLLSLGDARHQARSTSVIDRSGSSWTTSNRVPKPHYVIHSARHESRKPLGHS